MDYIVLKKDNTEEDNIEVIRTNIHILLQDFATIHFYQQYITTINRILNENNCICWEALVSYLTKYELNDYYIDQWEKNGVSDDTLNLIQDIKNNIYNLTTDALNKIIGKI